jgi:hypothetical protein
VGRDYSLSNGLLLRADIHALFDAYLLSIDKDGRVHVSDSIKDITYTSLQNQLLARPKDKWPPGLAETLDERHAKYLKKLLKIPRVQSTRPRDFPRRPNCQGSGDCPR